MPKNHYNPITITRYLACIIFLLMLVFNSVLAKKPQSPYKTPDWGKLKTDKYGLEDVALDSGFQTGASAPTIAQITGQALGLLLSLLGVVFMILIIYGGIVWMTGSTSVVGGANKQDIIKAKGIIINAVIGAIVVFSAYAISNFIIDNLYTATATK